MSIGIVMGSVSPFACFGGGCDVGDTSDPGVGNGGTSVESVKLVVESLSASDDAAGGVAASGS